MLRATWLRLHRPALVATGLALLAGTPPARPDVLFEATAGVNAAHDRTRTPDDETTSSRIDARPGVLLHVEGPRRVWRLGYLFSGSLLVEGDGENSYSNDLDLSLAAELGARTTLGLVGSLTQGDTEFRLTEDPAETGGPALRAPESPALVTAAFGETLAWESTQRLRLTQELEVSATSRQDQVGDVNWIASASLGADRLYRRDALGLVYSPRLARLRPLVGDAAAVETMTHSAQASWNHDFDPRWNAQVAAGIEQVSTLNGDSPSRLHPVGSLTARYFAGTSEGSLVYRHGATASLERGTMTLADEVVLGGTWSLGPARQLGASAGFLRSRPLAGTAPARGDAVSGDLGLTWTLSERLVASARYSAAYQFGEGPEVPSSLVQVALVGLAARYGNTPYIPPVPTLGEGRVDRGDAVGFPAADTEEEEEEEAPRR